jgi:hypothetical protein
MPANPLYYRMVYELIGGQVVDGGVGQVTQMLGLFGGGAVPSNAFVVYTLLYVIGGLAFGAFRFSKKDI